jgi:hypothetical protein
VLAELGLAGLTLVGGGRREKHGPPAGLSPGADPPSSLSVRSRPPLFTTRFVPGGLKDNLPVESRAASGFRLNFEGGTPGSSRKKPSSMADLLKARSLAGDKAFIVDLELDPRPLATARTIFDAIPPQESRSRTLPAMNYQRGLF